MFKGYSSKSSALKGAARAGVAVADVHMGDCNGKMQWGFEIPEAAPADTEASQDGHTVVTSSESVAPAADPELEAELNEQVAELMRQEGLSETDGEDGDGELGIFPQANASMFAGMASTLQNTQAATPAASGSTSSRTAYKIEKDRPMQNGVKRPSEGGACRAVWDWCWEQEKADASAPTSKTVKAQAEVAGWNTNNAMIEFYNWRKYNGISGRKPAAVAAPASQDAE